MSPLFDLVVVGAGPTGLSLAVQARSMGASVMVVERRDGFRPWAPALAVHPRTMEILRGLGVADELMGEGLSHVDLAIHASGSVAEGSLGELRLPATEYPFVFFVPQPAVEKALADRLLALGTQVIWSTELVGFTEREGTVVCELAGPNGAEMVTGRFLAGCDGAGSSVRNLAGIPFRGRSYRESILVADVGRASGLAPGKAHAFLRGRGILFFFPLPGDRWRLIAPGGRDRGEQQVDAVVEHHTRGSVEIGELAWERVVTPQHRVARTYRRGRVFLAGDAAHVHSPAGAQGMNTGIQDAANLGWKLAVAAMGGPDSLLVSYQAERRPVARHVVRLTGFAYALEVSQFAPLRWGRRWAALTVARLLLARPRLFSLAARMVSGVDTRYRRGAMAPERRSTSRYGVGRRVPDAVIDGGGGRRLHRMLDAPGFHLVISGHLEAIPEWVASEYGSIVSVHCWPGRLGGRKWVLVRPDGHIAVTGREDDLGDVRSYLERWVGRSAGTMAHQQAGVGAL